MDLDEAPLLDERFPLDAQLVESFTSDGYTLVGALASPDEVAASGHHRSLAALPLHGHQWHPNWTYDLHPTDPQTTPT